MLLIKNLNTFKISNKLRYALLAIKLIIAIGLLSLIAVKIYFFLYTAKVRTIKVDTSSAYVKKFIIDDIKFLVGHSIIDLNLKEIRNYLQQNIPWVESVSVRRMFNGTLVVYPIESEIYFIWKNKDIYKVVDAYGNVIRNAKVKNQNKIIVIDGDRAALDQSGYIRFVIYKDKDILDKIAKLKYNGFRWDIELKNGTVIQMPEENLENAWDMVVNYHKKYDILNKKIIYVDARVAGKVALMPIK